MFVSLHRRFLSLVLLGCMAGGLAPAATVLSPRMDVASGIDIRLESWLDACPPAGAVPVRIRIRNTEKQAHTWTITSTCNTGGASSVDLTVEGGQEGERMMYAPVLIHPESNYYNTTVHFRVKGPGVADEMAGDLQNSGGYSSGRTEYIAMSTALHAKGWSALENKFNTAHSGTSLQGSKVEIPSAPEDWRGYVGLAQLWMDEGDWTSMSATAKAAMMEWVAMGGNVQLLCTDTSEARLEQLGLPPAVHSRRRVGAGEIGVQSWTGSSLPVDAMATTIRSGKNSSRRELMANYVKKWGLAEIVGPLTIKSGLIFGFIAIFGLLVGPVNLFWLAGAGRRQRLFWTTPLLSLAASGLLLALMVLQDGIGGTGARTIFALMLPEQKRLVVTQEQVTKTGVLLGRSFGRADADLMAPISINTSNRQSNDWQSRFNVEESETHRNGAWFASRSLQAHVLQTVRPSRAGIEVFPAAGSAPSVLSTVEAPLKRVFIVEDGGKVWAADDVGTGEKKTMRASDIAELEQWMHDHSGKASGPMVKNLLQQMEKTPGFAYAEAADASKFAIATLPSIRWNHERLLLAGPYVKH